MRKKSEVLIAFTTLAIFGGLSIFTLPLRTGTPAVETGLTTEPCTLDEAIAEHEERIIQNRAYLDSLLEQAKMEAQTLEVVMEPREIVTETATEAPTEEETTTVEEFTEETETSACEPNTAATEVFQPVASMMPADLQAWVYAYATEQGVDPYIIMAVCERESCCTAEIYGDNGKAYGMMQIHVRFVQDKIAAHGYTNEMMLMAQPNITIGTEILKDYLNTGNGYEWALMAYNGGPQDAGSPATQEYARWVLSRAEELRR